MVVLRTTDGLQSIADYWQWSFLQSLLIIDDFGLTILKPKQDEDFHEVIYERYKRKSTIVTSNLGIP